MRLSRLHGSCLASGWGRCGACFMIEESGDRKKAGGPCEPPAVSVIYVTLLLAGAFAGRLCLLHLFRHLRFHGVKVETRAALHWRVIKEGLECLAHHLLDEDKAPELKFEPLDVLLSPLF